MKTKKDLTILGIVATALLVIGAFADMQISNALYNPESILGKVFEVIGELPASFIASFCAMSMAIVQKKRNNGKINLKCIGSFVLCVLLSLMAGGMMASYIGGSKVIGPVLGALILVVNCFIVKSIAKENSEELYKAAVMGVQLFLIIILLFNLVKFGWGRERYRHMVAIGDFTGFSAWYLPQGMASGNEFMSFPSGHSANAAISMWLTLLPTFIPAVRGKETLFKIISCIWIACVMVSRIIMGAHFLSDVTMGMTLSLLTFYWMYQRKYKKAPMNM